MKGLLAFVDEFSDFDVTKVLHWLEAEAQRADEAAWAEAWNRVHPARPAADPRHVKTIAAWTVWPTELAQEWLGLDLPDDPPPLPENVRDLLEKARPLLIREG